MPAACRAASRLRDLPDMGSLSVRLDRLYGAQVDYTICKKGENQCVGFAVSCIDDSFVPGGERLLESVACGFDFCEFFGPGNEGAEGLEDCAHIGNLFYWLEKRDFTAKEKEMIARENFLRVLR